MSWLFAPLYDPFMRGLERRHGARWRAELLSGLEGRVLEIGAGTGANLEHYPESVERVLLTEPDSAMRARLLRKLPTSRLGARGEVVGATVEELAERDEVFDAAVVTLVLCTVPDPAMALRIARERLAPGGKLVFVEHVASEDASVERWQRRLTPLWRAVAGGCHLDRRTTETIERAGFRFERMEREVLEKAPGVLASVVRGVAVKA